MFVYVVDIVGRGVIFTPPSLLSRLGYEMSTSYSSDEYLPI